MPSETFGMSIDETIRCSLFDLLSVLDPVEASLCGRDAPAIRLMELVQCCRAMPAEFVRFVLEREEHGDSDAGNAFAAWNKWLQDNDFPTTGATGVVHTVASTEALPVSSPESRPFPREWKLLVQDTRERVLGPVPQPPFSHWILPQPIWQGAWTEAFAVISPDRLANATATALVPSEESADSAEAHQAWRARVAAATRLSTYPVRAQAGMVAKIVGCAGNATPSYVLLERTPHGPRTLAERLRIADGPTPAQLLDLAVALCELLNSLAAADVRILDLRPELVAFEHSEGLRLTQLLDPTAVWPIAKVVPELRLAGSNLATMLEEPGVSERAQVFLVAALSLGMLCNTTQYLESPVDGSGRSTFFATFAGAPKLADAEHDRIAEPLIDNFRQIYTQVADSIATERLVRTCRWALSEEPDSRHQSLTELAASFRGPTRA